MLKRNRFFFAPDGGVGSGGASGGAVAGAGGDAGVSGGAAAAGDWTTSLDPDLRSAVTTKGYKTPGDLAKAYFNLEKTVGLDKVPLPPKGADGNRDFSKWDGWNALGRPDSADKYDLTGFKVPDGVPVDQNNLKAFAQKAHGLGLTQAQLLGVLNIYGEDIGAMAKAESDSKAQSDAQFKQDIANKWGANKDAKLALAKKAATALGFSAEDLDQIEARVGSFTMLDKFATLGEQYFREDGALPSGGRPSGVISNAADARAEIQRIQGEAANNPNHAYWDKKHPEHEAVQEKLLRLAAIVEQAQSKQAAA